MRLSDQTAEKILSEEIDIYDILAGTETNILDGEDATSMVTNILSKPKVITGSPYKNKRLTVC